MRSTDGRARGEPTTSDAKETRSAGPVPGGQSRGARGYSTPSTVGGDRRRARLAFFIPDLSVGGAEQVTVDIVNGLASRGHDVDLLLSRFDGELKGRLSDDVTPITLAPKRTSVLGVAAHAPAIRSYVRRARPDALVPHLEHPSVVCLAVARAFDLETMVVPTQHSAFGRTDDETLKDRLVRGLVPRLYPSADRLIAVSEGVADSVATQTPVDRDGISVLHNPVDVDAIRERARKPVDHEWVEDDDTEVVLFVGRHAGQKDLETWLRTFERAQDRRSGLRGVIVGKGPRHEAVAASVQRRGLDDVVSMPGFVDNPYRYMDRADVFLLSSRYEGLPTVLIEALACGCQVVSTDCPSGPAEILDGGLGRLAPVGDDRQLSAAVLEALDSPTPERRLRARADEFSPDAVLDEYERFVGSQLLG